MLFNAQITKIDHHKISEGLRLLDGLLVSGTISLPSRGTFHLSLTVLVHYR